MKRVFYLVVLMGLFLLTNTANTDFLGIKKSTETISFFLNDPLDSTGVARKPDSAHVLTYADNASAATFTATSTTYPFSDISIDTLKIYGDTIYVFSDAIADIDGAGGNFQLAIEVKLFCNTLPTPTHASIQLTADSLNVLATINDSLEAQDGWVATSAKQTLVIDTVNAILDTLQSQDGWVGTSAKQTLVIDTVNALLDTLQLWDDEMGLVTAMRDTINGIIDSLQSQDGWVSSFDVTSEFVIIQDTMETGDSVAVMPDFWSAADSAGYQGAAAGLTKANIADTVWSHAGRDVVIEDTLTTGDSVGVMPDFWSAADSTAYQGDVTDVADSVNAILDTLQVWDDDVALIAAVRDTANALLDTLQNQDDWVAINATLVNVRDTADAILDTLQLWDDEMALVTPMRDTINATLDTLQSQDGWVAKQAEIDSLTWRLGAEIGCYSYTHLNTGADTMWIVNGSDDTLSLFIFFHPGGAAGDPPDSFKVVAP